MGAEIAARPNSSEPNRQAGGAFGVFGSGDVNVEPNLHSRLREAQAGTSNRWGAEAPEYVAIRSGSALAPPTVKIPAFAGNS